MKRLLPFNEITVGSPPMSELIKKELKLEKGSGTPNKEKVGNVAVEQLISIAKMKRDGLFDRTLKAAVKTVAGTCNSLGLLVEGKTSDEFNKDLEAGKYDKELEAEKTEVSPEKHKKLQDELGAIQDVLKKEAEIAKAAEEAKAKEKEKAAEEVKEGEGKEEKKEEGKPEEKKEEPKKEEKKVEKK
jgi:hypothetical protein